MTSTTEAFRIKSRKYYDRMSLKWIKDDPARVGEESANIIRTFFSLVSMIVT